MEKDAATESDGIPAITLALRGERISLRNAVSSVYNPTAQQLLVASGPMLCLYGRLLETGGELLATLQAEPNVQFHFVLYLAWLDVYSVVATELNGKVHHRIVSTDLKTSATSHIVSDGTFYTAIANPFRRELLTADSDGGLKAWALRATTSTAAVAGGLKGILRVHTAATATRKPMYRQLCTNANGQKIFACTSSRIHIIDAATCARLSSCFRDQSRAIERIEYGAADDSLYVAFKDKRSVIYTFRLVQKKGSELSLKQMSEREASSGSVAFCCADQIAEGQRAESPETARGVVAPRLFILDDCGRFLMTDVSTRRGHQPPKFPELSLPMNPAAERYVALHSELRRGSRNLVFLVCSSGFSIVEVFLPSSEGRLVVTTTEGDMMKKLYDRPVPKISIFQPKPIPRILLLDGDVKDSHYVKLRVPTVFPAAREQSDPSKKSGVRLVDVASVQERIIVLWSNGTTEAYVESDERVQTIVKPGTNGSKASAMVPLRVNNAALIAIGDTSGTISIVSIAFSTTHIRGKREAHKERISALCDLGASPNARPYSVSLASIDSSGEVKLWRVIQQLDSSETVSFDWELEVCFRTYSSGVSSVTLTLPDFLFCGFEGGGVECWRLPSTGSHQLQQQQQQQHNSNRIAVVKRPLHSIDLHLTSVDHIVCGANAGSAVIRAQHLPGDDDFSWVVTGDRDGIVLIWCFSLELFFPHRRLKVHDAIRGCFLADATGSVRLFAYVGKCVEMLDNLAQGDKDAVRERRRKGREFSAKREQESLIQPPSAGGGRRYGEPFEKAALGIPASPADPQLDPMAAAVRISIVLPGVDEVRLSKGVGSRSPSKAPSASRAALVEHVRTPVQDPGRVEPQSRQPSPNYGGHRAENAGYDPMLPKPPILHTPDLKPEQTFVPRVQSECSERKSDGTCGFVPGMNSVPSSFSKAKPRVYRSRFNPSDASKKQTHCKVITTGGLVDEDDPPGFPTVSNQATTSGGFATGKDGIRVGSGIQEKVSVVSLADLEDESILMLDFRANGRRRRQGMSMQNASEEAAEKERADFDLDFLAWSGLNESQRHTELMAATKSRCVIKDAERDEVHVPSLQDFESSDMKVQLSIHVFTRWFAASHKHHQWIRERFLLEELVFAAGDPVVHAELASKGIQAVPPRCIGVQSSTEWQDFVSWYSYGRVSHPVGKAEGSASYKERIEARGAYLQQRLQTVEDLERKLDEEEFTRRVQRVFIFENVERKSSDEDDDVLSWENTSLANREKEVALALLDPDIQVAAMTHEIELPDLSGASLDDFDLLALAGKFVPWWKASGNKCRQDFLNQEVEEAAKDKSIREMLAQELYEEDGTELTSENFLKAYFKSDQARLTFLKRKLFYMKRKSRIASVAKYGRPPAPVVFETLPRPLSAAFRFTELESPRVEEVDESEQVAQNESVETSESNGDLEKDDSHVDEDSATWVQEEDENSRIVMEVALMAIEDELSREYNAQMMESDDEDDGKSLTPPKRTDFSRSYFFGNLPPRFQIPSSGWQSGSGIDNGDEEIEEEERLEQERERLRLLDQREAERLAEEERRAERARLEREQEEKAFQTRRIRQAELKKVLAHQAELEAKRAEESELKRIADETRAMLDEEAKAKNRLAEMAREQSAMEREDGAAYHLRKELRESMAKATRLLLNEQALMHAEDKRSAVAEKEHQLREREEEERRVYLAELYTSFEPFFASTNVPSEEFLPSIQRRYQERERRRRARLKTAPYTVPFAETLVMDEVEQEPYLARDSRKFNMLMGLPVRSSQSRRTTHIPSETDIVKLQRKQSAFDVDDGDRIETSSPSSPLPALTPQRIRQKSRAEHQRHKKPPLPDLVAWKDSRDKLTDINQAFHTQEARNPPAKLKASDSSSNQRPQAALPFFRGNLIVRGESKPRRAKDYSYQSG